MSDIAEQEENALEGETKQYLTFFIAEEEYGVNILSVREIRSWEEPTPLPRAPEYVKGVINLRGTIIPIIELRERFGLEDKEHDHLTVVVVLSIDTELGERTIGVVVDSVSDVYTLRHDEKMPPPEVESAISQEYVKYLATVEEKMIIILDVNKFIEFPEEAMTV